MEDKSIIINPTCNNSRIVKALSDAYKISMKIPFSTNISNYFLSIFDSLNNIMKIDNMFLQDAECFSIYKLYEKILKESGNFTKIGIFSEITLSMRHPGYVYQMEIFSLFAPYHYLTVVISPDNNFVDIYQSFGSTMRLHHNRLNIKEFERCIKILSTIKRRGKNFLRDYKDMLYVEWKLNGVDINSYMNILYNNFKLNDNDIKLDYTKEEEREYQKLGLFDPEFGEDLKEAYERGEPILNVTEYRPSQMAGKLKRKSKTIKKRKVKSIKKSLHRKRR
jgi:hypothetical protein